MSTYTHKIIILDKDVKVCKFGPLDPYPKPEDSIIFDLRGVDFRNMMVLEPPISFWEAVKACFRKKR